MKGICLLLLVLVLGSCHQTQKARKPIETRTGSFIKESVKRNKKMVAKEENKIEALIKKDSTNNYITSNNGFWYFFNEEKDQDRLKTPQKGDLITFHYNISTLDGNTVIYSRGKLGKRQFKMDKEVVFSGLRLGLKLMSEGETATFLFPSNLAFGYYGDNQKIGRNMPIRSTITLNSIEKQTDSIQLKSEN